MTRKEVDAIFETNLNGEFIRLIVPAMYDFPEINLIGKKRLDMTLDEIVLVKKYAGKLYSEASVD